MGYSLQIMGVQGSGKSTINSYLDEEFEDYNALDYADLILEESEVKSKNEISGLETDEKLRIYDRVNERLGEMTDDKKLLVENHLTLRDGDSFLYTTPDELEMYKTKAIINITPPPALVKKRRRKSEERDRPRETVEEIKKQQSLNKDQLEKCYSELKIPYWSFKNIELEKTVNEISNIISDEKWEEFHS